jgi:hypothetical protein
VTPAERISTRLGTIPVLRIRSVEPLLNGGDVEAALVLITRLEAKLRPLRDDIYAALAVPH